MTTLRIAHAEPRPGRLANGGFHTRGYLVVLADDAGHRAVPIWIQSAGDLADLLERPAGQIVTDAVPQELTTRLLGAARARVTGVDIDVTEAGAAELTPEVTVARIGLAGPAGTRQVTADLGLGLALAAAAGAPVRLADAVLDRLAVPVQGDDLLTPFLDRVPRPRPGPAEALAAGHAARPAAPLRAAQPGLRRRPGPVEPGLRAGRPGPEPGPADGGPDYAAAAEGPSAVLSSAVPRPAGSAALVQAIYADDYRGAIVTFSGEIRVDALTGQAGLRLEILRNWWETRAPARITASPSPAGTATGPRTRSRSRSPRTPTSSGSAPR